MGASSSSRSSRKGKSLDADKPPPPPPRVKRHADMLTWRIRSLRKRLVKRHEESNTLRKSASVFINSSTTAVCSEVDGLTIRNKLSSSERKLYSSDKRLSDHRDSLEVLILNFEHLNSDINDYSAWLANNHTAVIEDRINVEDSDALKENETIMKDLKHKQNILTRFESQCEALTMEQGAHCRGINVIERHIVEERVREIRSAERSLATACAQRSDRLRRRIEARRDLHVDVNTAQSWLVTARAGLKKYNTGTGQAGAGQQWPLDGNAAQQKLDNYTSMQKSIEEKNIQIMKMLDDSIVVIKDCGTEYSDMIKRKLDEIRKSTKELVEEINEICVCANDIVPRHVQFHSDLENITAEINKVENSIKDASSDITLSNLEDAIQNNEVVNSTLVRIERTFQHLANISSKFKSHLSDVDNLALNKMIEKKTEDILQLKNASRDKCHSIYNELMLNCYSSNASIENQYAEFNNSNKNPEIKLAICQELSDTIPSKLDNISELQEISPNAVDSSNELEQVRRDLCSLQEKLVKRSNRLKIVVSRRDKFLNDLQQNFDKLKIIQKDIISATPNEDNSGMASTQYDHFIKTSKLSDDIINDEIAADDSILTSVNNDSAVSDQINEIHAIKLNIKETLENYTIFQEKYSYLEKLHLNIESKLPPQEVTITTLDQLNADLIDYQSIEHLALEYKQEVEKMSDAAIKVLSNIKAVDTKDKIKAQMISCKDISEKIEFKLNYQLETIADELRQRDDVTRIINAATTYIDQVCDHLEANKHISLSSRDVTSAIHKLRLTKDEMKTQFLEINSSLYKALDVFINRPTEVVQDIDDLETQKVHLDTLMDSTIKDLGIGLEVRLQYEELLVSLPLWFEDCNSLLNNSTMDAQNIEQIKNVFEEIKNSNSKIEILKQTFETILLTTNKEGSDEIRSQFNNIKKQWDELKTSIEYRYEVDQMKCIEYEHLLKEWLKKVQRLNLVITTTSEIGLVSTENSLKIAEELIRENEEHLETFANFALLRKNSNIISLHEEIAIERDFIIKQILILQRVKTDWSEFNEQLENLKEGFIDLRSRYDIYPKSTTIRDQVHHHSVLVNEIELKRQKLRDILVNNEGNLWNIETPPNEALQLQDSLDLMKRHSVTSIEKLSSSIEKLDNYQSDIINLQSLINESKVQFKDCKDLPEYAQRKTLVRSETELWKTVRSKRSSKPVPKCIVYPLSQHLGQQRGQQLVKDSNIDTDVDHHFKINNGGGYHIERTSSRINNNYSFTPNQCNDLINSRTPSSGLCSPLSIKQSVGNDYVDTRDEYTDSNSVDYRTPSEHLPRERRQNIPEVKILDYDDELTFDQALKQAHLHMRIVCDNCKTQSLNVQSCQESLHEIEMAEKCVAAAEHTDDEILDVVESDNCLRDQLTQLSNQITLFRIQIQKNLVYVTTEHENSKTLYVKIENLSSTIKECARTLRVIKQQEVKETKDILVLNNIMNTSTIIQRTLNEKLREIVSLTIEITASPISAVTEQTLHCSLSEIQSMATSTRLQAITDIDCIRNELKHRDAEEFNESLIVEEVKESEDDRALKMILNEARLANVVDNSKLEQHNKIVTEKLKNDLCEHNSLLTEVMKQVDQVDTTATSARDPRNTKDLWRELAENSRRRVEHLNLILKNEIASSTYKYSMLPDMETTTKRLSELKTYVSSLNYECKKLASDDTTEQAKSPEEYSEISQNAVRSFSDWLDNIESRVINSTMNFDTDDDINFHLATCEHLSDADDDIVLLTDSIHLIGNSVAGVDEGENIDRSIKSLLRRYRLLHGQAKHAADSLKADNDNWLIKQEKIRSIQAKLCEQRQIIECVTEDSQNTLSTSQITVEHAGEFVLGLEHELDELKLSALQRRSSSFSYSNPSTLAPPIIGIDSLKLLCSELKQKSIDQSNDLKLAITSENQYEKMLSELTQFLDAAQAKLNADNYDVVECDSLTHLISMSRAHAEYYTDLESTQVLIDVTSSLKVDRITRQRYASTHSRLANLTAVILDKAAAKSQLFSRAEYRWNEFNKLYESLMAWFNALEPLTAEGDVIDDQNEIWRLETQLDRLATKKSDFYEMADRGHRLLHMVNCDLLEKDLDTFESDWVMRFTDTKTSLKRHELLLRHSEEFKMACIKLENAIKSVEVKVAALSKIKKGKTNEKKYSLQMLNLAKDLESHRMLKSQVQSLATFLSETPGTNETVNRFNECWSTLARKLQYNEFRSHADEMALQPARKALFDLEAWLHELEIDVKKDEQTVCASLVDTQVQLQKYRIIALELNHRRESIEFVARNASSTRLDVTTPPGEEGGDQSAPPITMTDRTNEIADADRLGTVIHVYQNLTRVIDARIELFKNLETKWKLYENGLNNEFQWIEECSSRVSGYTELAHEISIRNARKDATIIYDGLENRKIEIEKLKILGYSIIDGAVDCSGIQAVDENQLRLNNEIINLKTKLVNLDDRQVCVLDLYSKYNDYQTRLNTSVAECHHLLMNCRLLSGDVNSFSTLIDKIISFQCDYESSEATLIQLKAICKSLLKECPPLNNGHLPRSISDMSSRWYECKDQLIARISEFNAAKESWTDYETFIEALNDDITDSEGVINNKEYNNESLKKHLCEIAARVADLPTLSETLVSHMNSITMARVTSLETRLASRCLELQQRLEREQRVVTVTQGRMSEFNELAAQLNLFLTKANQTLSEDLRACEGEQADQTISDSSLEDSIQVLKALTTDFNDMTPKMDRIIQLAYRIALDGKMSSELKKLQNVWKSSLSEATERCRIARTHQVSRLSFNEKCCRWLQFISDVEEDLQAPLSANFEVLQSQQSIFQLFYHRVYMRQQNLFSIINEGNLMLENGFNAIPRDLFQDNLKKIDKQWLMLVDRISQRKSMIDILVSDWMKYRDAQTELQSILDIVESTIAMVIVDKRIGIQQASKLRSVLQKTLEKAKSESFVDVILLLNSISKFEIGRQHAMITSTTYKHYRALGEALLQRANADGRTQIQKQLDNASRRCQDICYSLGARIQRMDEVVETCASVERDISRLHDDLRRIRSTLERPLPSTFKELECLLEKIRDYKISCTEARGQIGEITASLDGLDKYVSADDIVLLRQRLIIIDKQWQQIQILSDRNSLLIMKQMDRWSNFDLEHRRLLERFDSLELSIRTEYDSNIDDILDKLENGYQTEYDELSLERYKLTSVGEILCKSSTDCQQTNITLKLTSLEAKSKQVQSAVDGRVKKIKDTVSSLGQLQTTMSELMIWLNSVECLLRTSIVYQSFKDHEIDNHLDQIKIHQKDIDNHSTAVTSVLGLCDLLLTDMDACSSFAELNSLRDARKSLHNRWHSIGTLIIERRISVENTGTEWNIFTDMNIEISDWLKECEINIASLHVEGATISVIKKEVKVYEKLQNTVQENLSQLEKFSSFYRKLARKGQVDKDGTMRGQVTSCYSRWDEAWRCIYASSRRRRHLLAVSDDFNSAREGVIRWLADVNERLGATWRLTDELRGNKSAAQSEISELEDLNRELANSSQRMAYIEKAGKYLIQRCEPSDSVMTQQYLDEFTFIREQIVTKIKRCLEKLTDLDNEEIRSVSSMSEVSCIRTSSQKLTISPKYSPDRSTRKSQLVYEKDLSSLKIALDKATKQILEAESLLQGSNPIGPETHDLPNNHYVASIYKCEQSIEELRTLEDTAKLTKKQKLVVGVDNRIKSLLKRWQNIKERAIQKDELLKGHSEQWLVLRKDLSRLNIWLDEVDLDSQNESQPTSLRDIEIATRAYIDLNTEITSWKSVVLSMNALKNDLKDTTKTGKKLRSRMTDLNRRWDRVQASTCCRALSLGACLTHCRDFTETLRELLAWLDATQLQVDTLVPVDYTRGEIALSAVHSKFKDVRTDLDRSHSQIEILREMSELLLTDPEVERAVNSRDKLNIITNRYNTLRKICQSNMLRIESLYSACKKPAPEYYKSMPHLSGYKSHFSQWVRKLFVGAKQSNEEDAMTLDLITNNDSETGGDGTRRRYCMWLLPLLLLLLAAALTILWLWPACTDVWSTECSRMNNFKYSLQLMLTYPDGPPPS